MCVCVCVCVVLLRFVWKHFTTSLPVAQRCSTERAQIPPETQWTVSDSRATGNSSALLVSERTTCNHSSSKIPAEDEDGSRQRPPRLLIRLVSPSSQDASAEWARRTLPSVTPPLLLWCLCVSSDASLWVCKCCCFLKSAGSVQTGGQNVQPGPEAVLIHYWTVQLWTKVKWIFGSKYVLFDIKGTVLFN